MWNDTKIKEYTKKINDAIQAKQFAKADYSRVNAYLDIIPDDLSKFKKSINGSSDEVSEVSQIYEFIINNEITDLHYLIEFVIDNDLYASFRRNYVMFKDLLHLNLSYRKETKK